MVLTQPRDRRDNEVSQERFPYHYGSYATLDYDLNRQTIEDVSIPLWFLRNRTYKHIPHQKTFKFPYHYGSYATEYPKSMEV